VTRVLLVLTCLAALSVTPGCGLIALTAFTMYVIDHPDGPPKPGSVATSAPPQATPQPTLEAHP